jgi:hypothetical protein
MRGALCDDNLEGQTNLCAALKEMRTDSAGSELPKGRTYEYGFGHTLQGAAVSLPELFWKPSRGGLEL